MEIFNGSDDEVIGRLAEVATIAINKKQAKVIRAAGHLPKELARLVAGYSAIDARIVRVIYDGRNVKVKRSFALDGERWKIILEWVRGGDQFIMLSCGRVSASRRTCNHELCEFLLNDKLVGEVDSLKKQLCVNYRSNDEHLAGVWAAVRLAIYNGLLEQYPRLATPST